jgi:hypothetical protein
MMLFEVNQLNVCNQLNECKKGTAPMLLACSAVMMKGKSCHGSSDKRAQD